jgi:hypothetical protein
MPLALASFVNPIAPCAPAVTTTISRPSLLPYSYFSQLPIASRQEISTSSYSSNRPSHACFRPTLTPDQFSEDSIALLLGELAALGVCQPDGTFVTSLADLRDRLVEMAATSEAVCIDGLATRVQRPRSWANQKVLYDAKRHTHTAQGVVVSTIHGDLLWCDGGWPGSCHEHELLALSGIAEVLDVTRALTTADRQCQAWRSMEHLAKLARRWCPGAATLCTTTPGDSLARTFGRKLRFASRAELTQERRRPARPGDAPGRLDSPGRLGLGRRSATGYRDS